MIFYIEQRLSMKNGPDDARKSNDPWENNIMPSILRGSKAHNEKVLVQRASDSPSVTSTHSVHTAPVTTVTTGANVGITLTQAVYQDLFERAQVVATELESRCSEELVVAAPKANKVKPEGPANPSALYCHEALDSSPYSSPKKRPTPSIVLSPFSKAKQKAARVGVGLSEECRGVYTIDEIDKRIALLAEVNAKRKLVVRK